MEKRNLHKMLPIALVAFSPVVAASTERNTQLDPVGSAPALFASAPSTLQALASNDLQFTRAAEHTLSAHVAEINSAALQWIPNPEGNPAIRSNGARLLSGGAFRISLESDLSIVVKVDRVEEYIEDVATFVGHVPGMPESFVTLSVTTNGFHGYVDIKTDRYEISPIQTGAGKSLGLAIVKRLDFREMTVGDAIGDVALASRSAPRKMKGNKLSGKGVIRSPAPKSGGPYIFDKWILYTGDVSSERSISSFVSNLMSTLNDSFDNLDVDATALLNYDSMAANGYTSSGNVSTDNDDLIDDSDGVLDYVPGRLSAWGADTATLLVDDDNVTSGPAGAAGVWISGNGSAESRPFATVSDDFALATYLFNHEVGHVLGGYHQKQDGEGLNTDADCELAWEDTDDDWVTVMGTCAAPSGSDCTERINYWSSKDSADTYLGDPLGEEDPNPGDGIEECSDIANTMFPATLSKVETWESEPFSAPGSPSNVDVEPLQCYGQNTVSWSASSGEVGAYQVYRAPTTSFSSQVLIYQGPSSNIGINISQYNDPSYIRVRACNAAGCGSYSQGDQAATYTNGCL